MTKKPYEYPVPPIEVQKAMIDVICFLREVAEDQPSKVEMMMWGTVSLLESITSTGPFNSKEEE